MASTAARQPGFPVVLVSFASRMFISKRAKSDDHEAAFNGRHAVNNTPRHCTVRSSKSGLTRGANPGRFENEARGDHPCLYLGPAARSSFRAASPRGSPRSIASMARSQASSNARR